MSLGSKDRLHISKGFAPRRLILSRKSVLHQFFHSKVFRESLHISTSPGSGASKNSMCEILLKFHVSFLTPKKFVFYSVLQSFVNMKIIFYICDQWLYRRYIMFILCPCILHDALYFSTHFLVWDHSSRYEEPLKGIKLGSNFIGNSMGNGGEQGTREGDSQFRRLCQQQRQKIV